MANEPKKREPDIPPKQPDIQPEPRPQEIPQDKDMPEKRSPPMQLYLLGFWGVEKRAARSGCARRAVIGARYRRHFAALLGRPRP